MESTIIEKIRELPPELQEEVPIPLSTRTSSMKLHPHEGFRLCALASSDALTKETQKWKHSKNNWTCRPTRPD